MVDTAVVVSAVECKYPVPGLRLEQHGLHKLTRLVALVWLALSAVRSAVSAIVDNGNSRGCVAVRRYN